MAMPSTDSDELAKFGYKQELDRSLGLFSSFAAVIFQTVVMINLAWPRAQVYGGDHWYYRWGAFVFVGILGGVGVVYYLLALRGRPAAVLAEHRAGAAPAEVAAGEEA